MRVTCSALVLVIVFAVAMQVATANSSLFRAGAAPKQASSNDQANQVTGPVILNIPPRRMWGWGAGMNGYCGETSFQSTGIYYGNWWSQEQVRYADGNKELLIGVNDEKAAKSLLLQYTVWNYNQKTPQSTTYLAWLKKNIDAGHPVIAGWYEKQPKGDEDYDHIMPIIGYEVKKSKVEDEFVYAANSTELEKKKKKKATNPTDTDILHNDLYLQETSTTRAATVFGTRKMCSQQKQPTQPYEYCLPQDYNYGIAVLGNVDPNKLTFRTFLTVSIWTEPDWGAEDKKYETPISFTATATITGLTKGKKYSILRFDKVADLGDSKNFLTAKWAKRYDFTAEDVTQTYSNLDALKSDGTYFFRTVLA